MELRWKYTRYRSPGGHHLLSRCPKTGSRRCGWRKNDPVGLIAQPDGTLLVTKKTTDDPIQRVKEIDIGHITDPSFLFRILIGTYITGFTAIRIISKQRFPPFAGPLSGTIAR